MCKSVRQVPSIDEYQVSYDTNSERNDVLHRQSLGPRSLSISYDTYNRNLLRMYDHSITTNLRLVVVCGIRIFSFGRYDG